MSQMMVDASQIAIERRVGWEAPRRFEPNQIYEVSIGLGLGDYNGSFAGCFQGLFVLILHRIRFNPVGHHFTWSLTSLWASALALKREVSGSGQRGPLVKLLGALRDAGRSPGLRATALDKVIDPD